MLTIEKKYDWNAKVSCIHTLRCNVKSLAAEASIIRKEIRRAGGEYKNLLAMHRRITVRYEARHTQLALAFVRGVKYRQVEAKSLVPPNPARIIEKLKKHWSYMRTWKEDDVYAWIK